MDLWAPRQPDNLSLPHDSTACPGWLQGCCTGSACRPSNAKHPNCCVHSGQYLVLQKQWSARKKKSTKSNATQFYTSAFCWPRVSYQDVIIPPLVIASVINIRLQFMNFIMKTLCPSETIRYPEDLFFFSPLHLFFFSCLRFQRMRKRIYLFWWKHFTVDESPKAQYSCSTDGSCCSSSMPLQIRSQDVFYHGLKVAREQPEAKNKKAK